MRFKVFAGYCALAFVACGVLTYGALRAFFGSIDRAVAAAFKEEA